MPAIEQIDEGLIFPAGWRSEHCKALFSEGAPSTERQEAIYALLLQALDRRPHGMATAPESYLSEHSEGVFAPPRTAVAEAALCSRCSPVLHATAASNWDSSDS